MNLRFKRKKQADKNEETLLTLRRITGQKLIGVTWDHGEWILHFSDWAVFVEHPFPSPIIQRDVWSQNK